MRLIAKPNHNSGYVDSRSGVKTYDTVDLCDAEGGVYGSVHIDLFWCSPQQEPEFRRELYDALRRGVIVELDVAVATGEAVQA